MGRTALFNEVESRLGKLGEQRCEQITHSIIYHLWRQMPFNERQRIIDALALDLKELLMEPVSPREPHMNAEQWRKEGPIDFSSFDKFCSEVRRETELPGDGRDEDAIHAVFGALKSELPSDEVMHIQERLPKGLKLMWATA